jgi:cytochrome c oxidase subunit 3
MKSPESPVSIPTAAPFPSREHKQQAVRLGMVVFTVSEAVFLGALVCVYLVFRVWHPDIFQSSSRMLGDRFGALATLFLITSSFTMALSVYYKEADKKAFMLRHLFFTLVCAALFIVTRYIEFSRSIQTAALGMGLLESGSAAGDPGAALFFNLYFLVTGFHSLYIIIGTGIVSWLVIRIINGNYQDQESLPLAGAGFYWQMGIVMWLFIFPLVYLI